MLCSFLFIRWKKEMERGQEENDGNALILWESGQCVTLVAVKDLLQRINWCDRVPPSRVIGRTFTSTQSGDLVSNSLNLVGKFEPWGLEPFFLWRAWGRRRRSLVECANESLLFLEFELYRKTPWRECDIIIFLRVLQGSVWSDTTALLLEGFMKVRLILLANARRMVVSVWLPWGHVGSRMMCSCLLILCSSSKNVKHKL